MPEENQRIRLRPVIRVFVSSTFSDMKHERNALQADVFPKLEQLCLRNGFQFQAIDLRWGVSTEAALDHRTMRICLEELRRAQEISPEPNFLLLLGDRYGWRPLPEEISQVEFDTLVTAARSGGSNQSPLLGTHGKTAEQVLREWYRCDENALLPHPAETAPDRAPLNYILQRRTQSLGDGRDYACTNRDPPRDTQDWLDVQEVLWHIINVAFPVARLDQRFEHIDWPQLVEEVGDQEHPKRAIPQVVRFQGSATEQEIWCGAMSAANAERHVLAFFREIKNCDQFAPVEVKDFFDVTDSGSLDEAVAARQRALKEAIRKRLGENATVPIPFSRLTRQNDRLAIDASKEAMREFCEAVESRLRSIIERQFQEYWHGTAHGSVERALRELELEQQEHARVSRERGSDAFFVGREVEREKIRKYLSSNNPWPLVVHGASGCGKTALLARVVQEAGAVKSIVRLVGIHPRCSDLRGLLSSLCQELRRRNPCEGPLPTEIEELRDEFHEHLKAATAERPLILFLDALDQLTEADNGRLLHWLPSGKLPDHVKLVVSCLSDRSGDDPVGTPYTELKRPQRHIPAGNFINLDVLTEVEARSLLFDYWLYKVRRTVSSDQRTRIEQRLTSAACRQPIYLKLLFEEVRLWHSYDLAPVVGDSVHTLLGQLFDRLSLPTNHGLLLVGRMLGYLAASRHGLAENEILEILFADREYRARLNQAIEQTRHEMPPRATRIPIAIWSRLRFDLEPYLAERAARGTVVLTFYHRQIGELARTHFLEMSKVHWHPHERLADFFKRKADPAQNLTWRTTTPRALEELPYHVAQSANLPRWERTVCDPLFVEAACRAGLVFEFLRDVDDGLRRLPSACVQLMRQATAASLRTITNYPEFCLSILCNRLLWTEPDERIVQAAARASETLDASGPWLRACSPFRPVESIPLDGRSHQAFIVAQQAFAVTNETGHLEIRSIRRGELLVKRTLETRTMTALAVEPAQFSAAWLERNGDIRAEFSQNVFPGRAQETTVAYPRDDEVIAVSRAGDLVAWNPQLGETTVLAAGIPYPLVVLRTNLEGSRILFVAGDRPLEQTMGIVSRSDSGWVTEKLRWNGRPVKHGCLNPDGTRALLVDSGRGMSIVEVASGMVLASTHYERRGDVMAWGGITACALGNGRENETAVVTTDKGQVWAWNWKLDRFTACGNYKGLQEGDAVHLLEIMPEGSRIFLSTANRAVFFSTEGDRSAVPHSAAVADCAITESELVGSVCREDRVLKWWRFDGLAPLCSFPVEPPRVLAADANEDCVFLGTDNGLLYRFPADRAPESKDIFRLFDHPVVNIVSDRPGVAIAASTQGLVERVDFVADRSEWLYSHTSGHRQRWLLPRAGGAYITVREPETAGRGNVVALGTGQNRETELYKSRHSAVMVAASRDGEYLVIYDRALKDDPWFKVFKLDGNKLTPVFTVEAKRSICAMHLLSGDKYLLLAQRDEPWLELRRLEPGLPVAAVLELPSATSCLCARQDRIAIGFQSGDLLCLRVRDASRAKPIVKL
jgi:hypothetical protein